MISMNRGQKNYCAGGCEASGIEFDYENRPNSPWQPSIDRIANDRGYVKDNCQLVCYSYNTLKGIGTHEELLFIAKALLSNPNEKKDLNQPHPSIKQILAVA